MIDHCDFQIASIPELDKLGPMILTTARSIISQGKAAHIQVGVYSHTRSLEQNALKEIWYREIWKQGREMTTAQARRFCKLHIGVPIMRASDEKFRQAWDSMIKTRLTYPEKLELMDWWPVTSLMREEQMREYLDAMQNTFAEKGINLVSLKHGQEQYPEAAA